LEIIYCKDNRFGIFSIAVHHNWRPFQKTIITDEIPKKQIPKNKKQIPKTVFHLQIWNPDFGI